MYAVPCFITKHGDKKPPCNQDASLPSFFCGFDVLLDVCRWTFAAKKKQRQTRSRFVRPPIGELPTVPWKIRPPSCQIPFSLSLFRLLGLFVISLSPSGLPYVERVRWCGRCCSSWIFFSFLFGSERVCSVFRDIS